MNRVIPHPRRRFTRSKLPGLDAIEDCPESLFCQHHLSLRLVQVLENLILASTRVVFAKLTNERHTVAHVHGSVVILGRLKECLEVIGVNVHIFHFGKHFLDLEQRVGGRSESEIFAHGISIPLALPRFLYRQSFPAQSY